MNSFHQNAMAYNGEKYFVYIIDAPSADDVYNNRYIGKSLHNALQSICIDSYYTEAYFKEAIEVKLKSFL